MRGPWSGGKSGRPRGGRCSERRQSSRSRFAGGVHVATCMLLELSPHYDARVAYTSPLGDRGTRPRPCRAFGDSGPLYSDDMAPAIVSVGTTSFPESLTASYDVSG